MKDGFANFVAGDGIYKGLQKSINMDSEGVKLLDQFKTFKDSEAGPGTFSGSLYRYCDGSWFRGQRSNRKRDGKGKLQLATGDLYEGQFIRGLRHGFGSMRYQTQGALGGSTQSKVTEYKGNFKFDMKEGTATLEFQDGSRFHGYFKENDQFYGQFLWPAESRAHPNLMQKEYTGYWKGPIMQGQGILLDKDSV